MGVCSHKLYNVSHLQECLLIAAEFGNPREMRSVAVILAAKFHKSYVTSARTDDGYHILHLAAKSGSYETALEAIRLLKMYSSTKQEISKWRDPSEPPPQTFLELLDERTLHEGWTALHIAAAAFPPEMEDENEDDSDYIGNEHGLVLQEVELDGNDLALKQQYHYKEGKDWYEITLPCSEKIDGLFVDRHGEGPWQIIVTNQGNVGESIKLIHNGDTIQSVNDIDLSQKSYEDALDILTFESSEGPYCIRFLKGARNDEEQEHPTAVTDDERETTADAEETRDTSGFASVCALLLTVGSKALDMRDLSPYGYTPLLLSVQVAACPAAVALLLVAGASPKSKDARNISASKLARYRGHTDVIALLAREKPCDDYEVVRKYLHTSAYKNDWQHIQSTISRQHSIAKMVVKQYNSNGEAEAK